MAKTNSIFVADDHPAFSEGLSAIIKSDSRWKICGAASNGEDALTQIRALKPMIAVLDVSMPKVSGLEIARTVKHEKLRTKIIILTMFDDGAYLHEALDAGVLGYLLKDSIATEILKCIEHVSKGKKFISPSLTDLLLQTTSEPESPMDLFKELTPTEKKILLLLAQNKTSAQIAKALFISTRTVQNHRVNIAAKLNLSGYNKLLEFALQNKSLLKK
ncbi:MAG: response regulator transcription factor [Bacteroidetes bacterium]|nr:response regulator transcription factor [Bacteroidota bacterium]